MQPGVRGGTMRISIDLLTKDRELEYEHFLLSADSALLYYSLRYREFLSRILDHSKPFYFIARENGRIVGALPSFLRLNDRLGHVLNALPFFGSNGGVLLSPDAQEPLKVQRELLNEFHSFAHQEAVVTSTIVSNPLDPATEFYECNAQYTAKDDRIGQITALPSVEDASRAADSLMALYHSKTRNAIRKAMSSSLEVRHSGDVPVFRMLAYLHQENMVAINGQPKPWSVFATIHDVFTYDRDYRIYVALRDGVVVAALLVFFFNRTAEYFTPASKAEYRPLQPMSLLIFEAMQEAVRRGCRYWNWGGTWTTQAGVYQFKSRWGTQDLPYHYYVREYDVSCPLRRLNRSVLLAEYPYFYVLPFSVLDDSEQQ